MLKRLTTSWPLSTAVLVVAGCASAPLTTTLEPQAMQTALTRARFEMNCQEATGQVLSSQNVAPLVETFRYRRWW